MTDALTRFHEQWLGIVQPVEGLVVSVPVLVDAGVSRPDDAQAALQQRLVALAPPATLPERSDDTGARDHRIADLPAFFSELLALGRTPREYLARRARDHATRSRSFSTCPRISGRSACCVTRSTRRPSRSSRKSLRSMYPSKVAGPVNSTSTSTSLVEAASSRATDPNRQSDATPSFARRACSARMRSMMSCRLMPVIVAVFPRATQP